MPFVSIIPSGSVIVIGDSLRLQATSNIAPGTGFIWASESSAIATVDGTGLVRALKAGSTWIRACVTSERAVCGAVTLTVR